MKITVKSFKKSGPAQCYHCKSFGHGSSYCGNRPRCVNCAGNHKANKCVKTLEESPTCCNCGGSHITNYRGYQFYHHISDIENRKPSKPKSVSPSTNQIHQPTPETQSVSYAQTPSNTKSPSPAPS